MRTLGACRFDRFRSNTVVVAVVCVLSSTGASHSSAMMLPREKSNPRISARGGGRDMRATDVKAAETLSLPKCITNIGASQGLPGLAGHLRGRGALAELSKELHNCNVKSSRRDHYGLPDTWCLGRKLAQWSWYEATRYRFPRLRRTVMTGGHHVACGLGSPP